MRFVKCSFIFLFIITLSQSCNTIDVYEKTIALPHQQWKNNVLLNFTCNVNDSNAYYNIYFVIRHTESYHFNNIWVNLTSVFPKDTAAKQKLNIPLAGGNGWLGTSMDDIIEQRILITKQPVRLQAGIYKFSLQQIMREDPLEHVLNAGIRVEKTVQ